jgi:two-component system, cell cycle sensor histidine kinase and response regulator CckA
MSGGGLFKRLASALAGEDPDESLARGVAVLEDAGIAATAGPGAPWIALERGERRLELWEGREGREGRRALDPESREVVRGMLTIALARAAERDEHRRTAERLDMLSAASFEGLMIHVDGVIIDANQRLAEMLGYPPAEVLGPNTMRRCVAPEDLPEVLARLAGRQEGEYVITGVRRDGSRFRAELQTKQGRLGNRPVRVVAVRDVTERERTHELLRESETRLRDLAEASFDLTVLSRDGVVVDVAGALQKVIGRTREQCIGRPILDFVTDDAKALTGRMLEQRGASAYETWVRTDSGERVPVEVVAVTTTLNGEPVRLAGLRDRRAAQRHQAEQRKLEQRVERSQRLESLGVLAGGIAHDFNNLLVGVMSNAELLLERVTDPVDVKAAEAICIAGQRAAALTGQMLAYAGQRDLAKREPLDLGALWRELAELLGATLSKKAHVELSISPGSVVLGDRATLSQVLMNLLTNASDALGDAPGRIVVRTRRVAEPGAPWAAALGARVGPGDWVLVEVEDDGAGMDAETLARAFEPFFSTKEKGHGLGLAACLGIVRAHGGAILVESERGRGSRFSVLLPAGSPAPAAAPAAREGRKGRSARILIVDDEPLVRSVVRRVLERKGYAVEEAGDGVSGVEAIRRCRPDVVLLDMTMPDLNGAEALAQIRAVDAALPVVLSSGHVDAAVERGLDRSRFQGFLAKPYRVTDLLDVIEGALTTFDSRAAKVLPPRAPRVLK